MTMDEMLRIVGDAVTELTDATFAEDTADRLIVATLPPSDSDWAAVREPLRASIRAVIGRFGELLSTGEDPWTPSAPKAALDYARLLARQGIPLSTLLLQYHQSHNAVERELLQIVHDAAQPLPSDELFSFLGHLRRLTDSFITAMTADVTRAYETEATALPIPGNAEHLRKVLDVLGAAHAADDIGGYPMAGRHMALVFHPSANGDGEIDPVLVKSASRAIADAVGSHSAPLIVVPGSTEAWAWCTVPSTFPSPGAPKIPEQPGLRIAVGPPSSGLEGFRLSHRRAQRCSSLFGAIAFDAAVVDDRAPGTATAAAFVDRLADAADFVRATLGPLAHDDADRDVLRQTVRAYLASGVGGAAESLLVHRNTVKYRLDRVREAADAETIATPEFRVALELAHWYGPKVLAQD